MPEPPQSGEDVEGKRVIFKVYCTQFVELSEQLEKLRGHWLDLVPEDDPMKRDEAAFRVVESRIMKDLLDEGASTEMVWKAHCLAYKEVVTSHPHSLGLAV